MMPPYNDDRDDDEEEENPSHWEPFPASASSPRPLAPAASTWVRQTRGLVFPTWEPKPLPPPRVDSQLGFFNSVERSAEVFRYTFQKAEYWLSPGGLLREWIRLNLRIACVLVIPALLVAPLVTCALRQISIWISLLNTTTSALVLFPLSALLVLGLVCALVYLGKSFQQRPRPRQTYYE